MTDRRQLGWCFRWAGLSCVLAATGPLSAQPPAAPVVVATVLERTVAGSQAFTGSVMPRRNATIGSAVFGRVVEMTVEEGDAVKAGEPLVKLLTETISLELEAARAELELRQQELEELKNGARPEELRQSEAALVAAEARRDYFDARQKRVQSLFSNGRATSAEERDEAESAGIGAAQAYQEALATYELTKAGPRRERIAQAQARVDIQHAIVKRLEDQIRKHTIVSRFNGYVTAKHTEIGQWVNRGDEVMDVVELDVVDVLVYVVEDYIPHVPLGREVTVEVPAMNGRTFPGRVAAVIPQADLRARTFPVKVRVDNPMGDNGPVLKSGMLARVMLPTGPLTASMLVPKDAVVLGGPQPVVLSRAGRRRGPTACHRGCRPGRTRDGRRFTDTGSWRYTAGNASGRPRQ